LKLARGVIMYIILLYTGTVSALARNSYQCINTEHTIIYSKLTQIKHIVQIREIEKFRKQYIINLFYYITQSH